MQTFLPYPDFKKSARALDWRRLGKQRAEAYLLLQILKGERQSWHHHPAVKMWRGFEDALGLYLNSCIEEWIRRGYKNTMAFYKAPSKITFPDWLGLPELHSSHRSNLLRKAPAFYSQYGWKETPDQPYYWPGRSAQPAARVTKTKKEKLTQVAL